MAKKDKDELRQAAQPTKREMVIAQRQAQVAEGDSVLSISNRNNIPEADLLAANPGVVTVRPGQVVNIPPPAPSFAGRTQNGGRRGLPGAQAGTGAGYLTELTNVMSKFVPSGSSFGTSNDGGNYRPRPSLVPVNSTPFAGAQAKVGVGTVGGQPNLGNYNTSYNGFQTPTTNGFKAPTPYAGYTGTAGYGMQGTPLTPSQANFQTPTTNGFTTPGYTNLTPSQSQSIPRPAPQQPYLGASSYTNPALQPPTSQTQTPMMPVDEKGKPIPYTGNPNDPNTALWKKYWDDSARAGVDLAGRNLTAPTVMTRDQIWQMKADQRRRQAASAEQDGTAYNQPAYQYDTTGYGVGSPLVRNITWSIRG